MSALEPGITLVEASAGTGKTHHLTTTVLRLVMAGIPLDRLLVVTYTRAATAELKDRLRARIAATAQALEGPAPLDPALGLADAPAARDEAAGRLRQALADFDQAVISTIHGFCQRMLQQNAFESGAAFDLELLPDPEALVAELVDDHLAHTYYAADPTRADFLRGPCGLRRDQLLPLAQLALADPDTAVHPAGPPPDPGAWAALAAQLAADWPAHVQDLIAAAEARAAAAEDATPARIKRAARTANEWGAKVQAWLDQPSPLSIPSPTPTLQPLQAQALDALVALRDAAEAEAGALRAAFVAQVRTAFEARKAQVRVQTYQDLLRDLAGRLGPDAPGRDALIAAIGGAFDAALIDEFQDTDHLQWTLFREVFGQGQHHLVLIGDPKQAIYGFRGANIHVYTQATGRAQRRETLDTNWRSDARLLGALNHLLDRPGAFGPTVGFAYQPVHAPPGRGEDGLRPPEGWEAPGAAPLQIRWFDATFVEVDDPEAVLGKGALNGPLEARVAEDVVELLSGGTTLREGEGWRPVEPGDIAVLARKGRQAQAVQDALRAVGVPAVLAGAASVLASDEAREVEHWLRALGPRSGGTLARVAASTLMFGWTDEQLRAVEQEHPPALVRWEAWLTRLASWRQRLHERGFLPAFRQALDEEGVRARLLALDDGERRVTNLMHVAELVHAAEGQDRLKPAALLAWLARRRVDEQVDREEAELRLDRDARAVRILTVHKSKGLEFPICFVPWLWDGGQVKPEKNDPLLLPDPDRRTRRLLDVGAPTDPDHRAHAELETREEALRLAYVALTRARHRCVLYTGVVGGLDLSPLAALLHGEGPDRLATGSDRMADGAAALRADLDALAQGSAGPDGLPTIQVLPCAPPTGLCWSPPATLPPQLAVRHFTRAELDPGWRRHSYSSLTRQVAQADLVEHHREGFDPDPAGPAVTAPAADEVPLAGFPSGPEAGTLLHEVLEAADFTAEPELGLRPAVVERLARHGFDPALADELVHGLDLALRTPLGGPLGGFRLRDLARADRLDELRFDLPLRGEDPRAPARGLIAALRARPADLPAPWLDRLDRLDGTRLAGFLTGSIDLVLRAPTADGTRWFVVDHKSNRLDPAGTGRCVPEGFEPAALGAEMARHDYFLQAHLYLLALHRLLRWRLPDYDYDRHVGGACYLFLRGMVGPDTVWHGDRVRGVWFDRPPRAVIEALDRAFEGGA